MKSRITVVATLVIASFMLTASLAAHHPIGAVYENSSITLKGTVTGYEWSNPHSIVSFAVKDDKGNEQQWHAEVIAPPEMERAGWTKQSIKPGDQVTVTGRPGKNA